MTRTKHDSPHALVFLSGNPSVLPSGIRLRLVHPSAARTALVGHASACQSERSSDSSSSAPRALRSPFAEHVFGFLCAYLCDLCVSAVNSIPVSFRFRQGRTGLLACAALLTPAAFAQAPNLAPVVSKSLSRTADLPGEFQPFLMVSLHARVAGYVDKVLVDRGSDVKQGQLLVELSGGDGVAGMFLEAGVMDLLDRGVSLEPARHLHGILRLSAHAVRECVQAAEGQPAIERRGHRAAIALRLAGSFKQIILVPGDERAADHVAVAANILGG